MTPREEYFEFVKQCFPHDNIRFEQYIGPDDFVPRYKIFFNETEVKGLGLSGDDWSFVDDVVANFGQSKKSIFDMMIGPLKLAILKSL